MAKSRQVLRVRASQTPGRRRKKRKGQAEPAFDDVKQLVSDIADRLLRQRTAKDTAAVRTRRKKAS